jgi:hypothetical protein
VPLPPLDVELIVTVFVVVHAEMEILVPGVIVNVSVLLVGVIETEFADIVVNPVCTAPFALLYAA